MDTGYEGDHWITAAYREKSGTLQGLLRMNETVQASHEWREAVDGMGYSLRSVKDTWYLRANTEESESRGPNLRRPGKGGGQDSGDTSK